MTADHSEHVLILGAGRFGRLALDRLGRRRPSAGMTVVDQDPDRLAPPSAPAPGEP